MSFTQNYRTDPQTFWVLLLLIVAGSIGLILCSKMPKPEDVARQQSDIRVAVVEAERNQYARELASVNSKLDSALNELNKKPKQITQIKIKYVAKRDTTLSLPVTSKEQLLSERIYH